MLGKCRPPGGPFLKPYRRSTQTVKDRRGDRRKRKLPPIRPLITPSSVVGPDLVNVFALWLPRWLRYQSPAALLPPRAKPSRRTEPPPHARRPTDAHHAQSHVGPGPAGPTHDALDARSALGDRIGTPSRTRAACAPAVFACDAIRSRSTLSCSCLRAVSAWSLAALRCSSCIFNCSSCCCNWINGS